MTLENGIDLAQRMVVVCRGVRDNAIGRGEDLHDARDWQERTEHRNSNELAAQELATRIIGRQLTRRELSTAARLVHFSFGAAVGAMYGALAETSPARRQSGWRLGASLWLAADEIAMPLVGLSDSTTRRPFEMHLQSFTAHLVYGVVTDRVRRLTRSLVPVRAIGDENGLRVKHRRTA